MVWTVGKVGGFFSPFPSSLLLPPRPSPSPFKLTLFFFPFSTLEQCCVARAKGVLFENQKNGQIRLQLCRSNKSFFNLAPFPTYSPVPTKHTPYTTYSPFNFLSVSILSIFPLQNHSSRIFFLDITNDAKKSLKPLGHMRPVGSVPQVKIDGPGTRKCMCNRYKIRKCY